MKVVQDTGKQPNSSVNAPPLHRASQKLCVEWRDMFTSLESGLPKVVVVGGGCGRGALVIWHILGRMDFPNT